MRNDVVALYVDRLGPYPKLVEQWWDKDRDANKYDGTLPVVAHPPCQLWVNFAALNYKRYGGEHNKPGNDNGCFSSALASVRRVGGVLEHPAFSNAWKAHALTRPPKDHVGWWYVGFNEWVCEVWQSAYGHRARKRTWLWCVSTERPIEGAWERKAGTHQVGYFDVIKPVISKRKASETPRAFAEWLLEVASRCRR